MSKDNFSETLNECPFYDDGDGGYGSHCNLTNDKCTFENCPLNEWYSSPKFGVVQENDGSVKVVTAE